MAEIYRVIDKRDGTSTDWDTRGLANTRMRILLGNGAKQEEIDMKILDDLVDNVKSVNARKPRSKKVEKPVPGKRVRSRGTYFAVEGGKVREAQTKESLVAILESCDAGMGLRVIHGHELKPERKVQYKLTRS